MRIISGRFCAFYIFRGTFYTYFGTFFQRIGTKTVHFGTKRKSGRFLKPTLFHSQSVRFTMKIALR